MISHIRNCVTSEAVSDLLPGLGQAAVRADCVSQKGVPRAAAGPARVRRCGWWAPGQVGRGGDELCRALLATRRSPAGGKGRRARA